MMLTNLEIYPDSLLDWLALSVSAKISLGHVSQQYIPKLQGILHAYPSACMVQEYTVISM